MITMADTQPLTQDIIVARELFEKDDFGNAMIFGNRILSNAVFLTEDQRPPFLLAGFFVKDIASELIRVASTSQVSVVSTAKTAAMSYFTEVTEPVAKPTFSIERFWQTYEQYSNRIRTFGNLVEEDHVYTENRSFTKVVADWIIGYLGQERDVLYNSRNMLLEGSINEIIRVYRAHGANVRELVILALLTYLQRVYSYIRYAFVDDKGDVDKQRVDAEIFPYVDSLKTNALEDKEVNGATRQLCDLLLAWRHYFIRFADAPAPRPLQAERGVQLPEETRKRITEAITKSLGK